jgi:hypothetical protein
MALNMQIFHQLRKQATREIMSVQQRNEENATHIYLEKEKIFKQQVKTIIIPTSIYKNKHMHNTNSRSKKNRGCLVQLYEAIIPI